VAELINKKDSLNDGRKKLNEAIKDSNKALTDSQQALLKAVESMDLSERTQKELTEAILEGDSSPLGGQLSVGADGKVYDGPQERLIAENQKLTSQLADIENLQDYEFVNKKRKPKGHVVFISDDGHKGDWEVLKPIFEQAGVPFCAAIITGWMDPDSNKYNTRMTWDQVRYLQNEMGCEIMSHSRNHTNPRITESPDSYVREE